MGKPTPARRVALQTISDCRRRGGRVRDVMRSSKKMEGLNPSERAFATRLALGTTAARGKLDEFIDERLRKPSALEPRVRDALRIATFDTCYLSTQAFASVSQGVELVRLASPRASGLANAVLRRLAKELRPEIDAARSRCADGTANAQDMALVAALPLWLVEVLSESLGADEMCRFALAQLEPSCPHVVANPARRSDEEAYALLAKAGLEPRAGLGEGSFVLGSPGGLSHTDLVGRCDVVPCDPASLLVARAVGVRPAMDVLELGQGRGTKTILLEGEAIRRGGPARIVGVDSVAFKTDLARKRMVAAGLDSSVSILACDARELAKLGPDNLSPDAFDLVFLDAPCTGVGTLRRHPEIAWSLSPRDVEDCARLEAELLLSASRRVRPGGTLCYATCSPLAAEDEEVVQAFLGHTEGARFELESSLHTSRVGGLDVDRHYLARLVARDETSAG